MSLTELTQLESTIHYLLEDYGHLTLQEFHDMIGDIIEPEEEEDKSEAS